MKSKINPAVPELLARLGELFEQRNKEYKNSYLIAGDVYVALFPNGLMLRTDTDFNRFAILMQIVNKLIRYSFNFLDVGDLNSDHLNDLATYAMMLQEIDNSNYIR